MEPPQIPQPTPDATHNWESGYKARVIKSREWDAHADKIKELYITRNIQLEEVRRIMAQEYGFYAKTDQYKKYLRTPKRTNNDNGRVKKNIPKKKATAMLRKELEREAEGKQTSFSYHGQPVSETKMENYRKRLQEALDALIAEHPHSPAATPSHVDYITPRTCDPPTPFSDDSIVGTTTPHSANFMDIDYDLSEPSNEPGTPMTERCNMLLRRTNAVIGDLLSGAEAMQTTSNFSSSVLTWSSQAEVDEQLQHAITLMNEYKLDGAYRLYLLVLSKQEEALGTSHPTVLKTVHYISRLFLLQGKYEMALEWSIRELQGLLENPFGYVRDFILAATRGIGEVLERLAKYDHAMNWCQLSLSGWETFLTEDQPEYLSTVQSIAVILFRKGDYAKALQSYQRALDGREEALGKDHPDTLATVNNMAVVLERQGQYEKALQWYQRALDGREKALGEGHPSTLTTVHNMAAVLVSQGQYEKALQWYQRALDGREKALGKDHPEIFITLCCMARVFQTQREYEKALQWFLRALESEERTLGKYHSSTLATAHKIALLFQAQGEDEKGRQWFWRALQGGFPEISSILNDEELHGEDEEAGEEIEMTD